MRKTLVDSLLLFLTKSLNLKRYFINQIHYINTFKILNAPNDKIMDEIPEKITKAEKEEDGPLDKCMEIMGEIRS